MTVLHCPLVTPLQEGYGGFAEGAEEVHLDALPGSESISYKESFDSHRLFSLEHRRLRRDQIKVYTFMRGTNRVESQNLLSRLEKLKN